MDTTVRPPEAPPEEPASTGTSRRRWPRRVIAGLILLLTVALVIGIVWVSNVDPLGPGSGTFAIRDPRVHATSHLVDAFGVFGLVQTVSVEPGATFDYQISVRNDGTVPVTVLNVGEAGGQITRRAVAMNLYPYVNPDAAPDRYVPFAPFRLGGVRKPGSSWK